MSYRFDEGFETNDLSRWTAVRGTSTDTARKIEIVTPSIRSGNYNLRCSSIGGTGDLYAGVDYNPFNGLPEVWTRAYLKASGGALSLPNDGDRLNIIIFWNVANVSIGRVGGVTQYQLRTFNPANNTWVIKNTGIAPGNLDCIELGYKQSETVWLYINNIEFSESLSAVPNNLAIQNLTFGMGITFAAGSGILSPTAVFDIDDCAADITRIGLNGKNGPIGGAIPWYIYLGLFLGGSVLVVLVLSRKK